MNELSGPASGGVTAHKYKGLDGAREPDTAHPATVAAACGGPSRASDKDTREGGGPGCASSPFAKSAFLSFGDNSTK
jgi:hypothetical protein